MKRLPVEATLEVPPGGSVHLQLEVLTTTPSPSALSGDAAEALRDIIPAEAASALAEYKTAQTNRAGDVTWTECNHDVAHREGDGERQHEDRAHHAAQEAEHPRQPCVMNKDGLLPTTAGMALDLGTGEAALEAPLGSDSRAR